jgi:ferric-dicitrate binding protein FerR (iron transport regulator)
MKTFKNESRRQWDTAPDDIDEQLSRRMWRHISRRIAPHIWGWSGRGGSGGRGTGWANIAAAVVAALVLGTGGYLAGAGVIGRTGGADRTEGGAPFTVEVDSGQKATLTLPDGTRVWMNSMSRLSYDGSYNHRRRDVTLEGEAYFEVARDAERRFTVHTGEVSVEALGTSFNVKSYGDDADVTTSLREGRVRVSARGEAMELTSLQRSVYNKLDGTMRHSSVTDDGAIDFWRSGTLVFDSTPLSEIARTIERMYGVSVEFRSEALRTICFSGTISNNSIQNIFYIMSLTYPISCTIEGSTVTIDERRP